MRESVNSHLPLLLLTPPTSWVTLDIQGRASLTDAYTPGMPAWPHSRPHDTTPTCRHEKLFEIGGTSYWYIKQRICPLNEIPWPFTGHTTKDKSPALRLSNSIVRRLEYKGLTYIIAFLFVCNPSERFPFKLLLIYSSCYYLIYCTC